MATTILCTNYNSLLITKAENIMQRSKNAHLLKFYVPELYEDYDMKKFITTLEFVTPDGQYRTVILEPEDVSTKEDYIEYHMNLTSDYTMFAGNLELSLTFTYVNEDTAISYVRKTTSTILEIVSVQKWQDLVTDESLGVIDQALVKMQAQVNALNVAAEDFITKKADNIKLGSVSEEDETQYIYLTSNDKPIGDPIKINDLGDTIAEDTVDGVIQVII